MRNRLIGFSLTMVFFVTGLSQAELPLRAGAWTKEKVAAHRLKYLLRDLDEFENLAGQGAIEEPVRDFLTRAYEYQQFIFEEQETNKLLDECAMMLNAHGDHPLVLLRTAFVQYDNGYGAVPRKSLIKLVDLAKNIDGMERMKLQCLTFLYSLEKRFSLADHSGRMKQWQDALVDFAESEQEIENQQILYDMTLDDALGDMEFADRVWESGASDWYKNMLKGVAHRDKGWGIRGSGFAHTVKEESWDKFHEQMQLAAGHFERAWRIDKSLAYAPSRMIAVSKVADEYGTPREWFLRTISAQSDLPSAYRRYFWALRPRWGGSLKEILDFGNECYETTQFDTDVPLQLLQAMRAVAKESEGFEEGLFEDDVVDNALNALEKCASGLKGKRVPRTCKSLRQLRSTAYDLAMELGRTERAKQLAEKVVDYNNRFSSQLEISNRTPRELDVELGLTDKHKEEFKKFWTLEGESKEERARKLTEKAAMQRELAANSENPRAKRLLTQFAVESQQVARFCERDWVDISFGNLGYDWYLGGGMWRLVDGGSVEMSKGFSKTGAHIYSYADFFMPLEVEVEIEFKEAIGPSTRVGILIGFLPHIHPYQLPEEIPGARCFWIDPVKGIAGSDYCFAGTKTHKVKKAKKYKLQIKAWEGYYVVTIDDQLIFERVDNSFKPDGSIGVGGLSFVHNNHEATFSNLRVRSLDKEPPAYAPEHPDRQVSYFTEILKQDPGDDWALTMRGFAHYANANYSQSLEDLRAAMQPSDEGGHLHIHIAQALARLGRYKEAKETFQEVIAKDPSEDACNKFAWFLATCPDGNHRDGKLAIKLACYKIDDDPDPDRLDTLAAAYAETGDFESAIETEEEAIESWTGDVTDFEARLRFYRKSKPFRSGPPESN